MLRYQQIHQLVSVDFFKKRSSLGFPETQVCVCLRCSGVQVGGAYLQAWQKVYFCIFFPLLPPEASQDVITSRFHPTFPSQSHAVPTNRILPVHISTFLCPQAHLGTPALARFQPVKTARGGAEGHSHQ